MQCITKMADIVAANILDLERGSSHLSISFLDDLPEALGADGLHFEREPTYEARSDPPPVTMGIDAVSDLEFELERTLNDQSAAAVTNWLNSAREKRPHTGNDIRMMRLLWRAAEELDSCHLEQILSTLPIDFSFTDKINGRSPLHESCISGRLELVEICLSKGVSAIAQDTYGRAPLHYAAMHGHIEICKLLLQQGVDATVVDMDGYTPLIQAVVAGHAPCVEVFINYAKGNILEPSAISSDLIPLSLACQHGRMEVAKLLLNSGAKVLPNSEGLYPQHLAARAGHAEICSLLVRAAGPDGGGKDRRDKYNMWTPLHHACVGGTPNHASCVKILLDAGCDFNAEDEYGKTPGFYAGWYGVSKV
jgi:CDK inhibitor PHO81